MQVKSAVNIVVNAYAITIPMTMNIGMRILRTANIRRYCRSMETFVVARLML
jgi:hypothetical protein